ncbi:LLM class flavin-dependent oxidoreductase [Cryptosporangium arvum]|uniref:LLM class flavin-dependent oxidoreductase n=1 Tax=Cryptosporangium arvum TaxID=80871 RepID=UPI0004B909D4|nr:LLM class flavin-dependent oxidoreductase [Cryptosporangium arvum]
MSMILGAMIFYPGGEHLASWRLPGAEPERYLDLGYYRNFARTAERGGFATLFIADELYVWDRFASGIDHVVNIRPEPFTLLGALSQVTERIGLAATVSTTYNEPFPIARKLASLDFLSEGRAGWNVVTSASDEEAWNFGRDANLDHAVRYRRAAEFIEVVNGLWDSWDDDAFRYDKESGYFADATKLHTLEHRGEFFTVRGPLNIARPPQGRPVIFQAGASEAGRALAGATAEAVFTMGTNAVRGAKILYDDYKARAAANGRNPDHLKVLPALSPVIGETLREAEEYLDRIEALTPERLSLDWLSHYLQFDVSRHPMDERFQPDLSVPTNQVRSVQEQIGRLVGSGTFTLREVNRALLRRRFLVGTPDTIADWMTERYRAGAADGFMLAFSSIPVGVDQFVDLVVPELTKRGVYSGEYRGRTHRENLGLPVPPSRYA